jgi:hypothetical protein
MRSPDIKSNFEQKYFESKAQFPNRMESKDAIRSLIAGAILVYFWAGGEAKSMRPPET